MPLRFRVTGTRANRCTRYLDSPSTSTEAAAHPSFTAATNACTAAFPSPKYIKQLSAANNGFGIPANPGLNDLFITITLRAFPTSRIGIPAIGDDGSVFASG